MKGKTYVALKTLKRMKKFHAKEILIKGETKEFNLLFNDNSIPHLLGLHYINEDVNISKGKRLKEQIIKLNISDQEILNKVNFYHGEKQKERVEKRINTFNDFINNLENAIIVEKNKERNIPLDYLIIRNKNGNFEHLGIIKTDVGDFIERFDDNRDEIALKTYIIENNDLYFKGTKISEKIEYIKEYIDDLDEYINFSFDEEKNKILKEAYKNNKELSYKEALNNFMNKEIDKFFVDEQAKFTNEQIKRFEKLLKSDKWEDRAYVAEQGYALDKLIKDKHPIVRYEVAEQGYRLDILVNDKEPGVRAAVARQGYGLDKLINDEHPFVRMEVAEQGYGLEKLVYDEHSFVRCEVARQGFGLEKLVDDEHPWVRKEVAKQGYGLDKLINDEDEHVRAVALEMLEKQKEKLIEDNNAWDNWKKDKSNDFER